VTGEKALAWVKARNGESTAELTKSPEFKALDERLLKILEHPANTLRYQLDL